MTISDIITAEAQRRGVPPALALAVAKRESGLNQAARGAAGEIGIFQLMPATAAALGVNAYDPAQNIAGGIAYLRQMFDRYGRWDLAAAAYNWGPGRVDDYLEGSRVLPADVRLYVAAVAGAALPLATAARPVSPPVIAAGRIPIVVGGAPPAPTLTSFMPNYLQIAGVLVAAAIAVMVVTD